MISGLIYWSSQVLPGDAVTSTEHAKEEDCHRHERGSNNKSIVLSRDSKTKFKRKSFIILHSLCNYFYSYSSC